MKKGENGMKKVFGVISVIVILVVAFVGIYFWKGNGGDKTNDGQGSNVNVNQSGENAGVDSEYQNIPEYEGSIQGRLDDTNTPVEYKKISGKKTLGTVEFTNIQIGKINDSKCVFTADVKNTSTEFSEAANVSIKVLDENGEVKQSFGGILTELAGLEPNKFKTYALDDITYADDIRLEIVEAE